MNWCSAYGIRSEQVDQTKQTWFNPVYGYARRYKEMTTIASEVYAAKPHKLVRVLECIQHVSVTTTDTFLGHSSPLDCAPQTDEVSTAPYVFRAGEHLKPPNPAGASINT